jgi:hypothetical protein
MTACKSCKAQIVWAISQATGRAMPVDAAPSARGTLVLEYKNGGQESRAATDDDRRLRRRLYTSHFATCPDAKFWRQ